MSSGGDSRAASRAKPPRSSGRSCTSISTRLVRLRQKCHMQNYCRYNSQAYLRRVKTADASNFEVQTSGVSCYGPAYLLFAHCMQTDLLLHSSFFLLFLLQNVCPSCPNPALPRFHKHGKPCRVGRHTRIHFVSTISQTHSENRKEPALC